MAESYVAIFYDWPEVTKELSDAEKGRLMDALVIWARGDDWRDRLSGNERYLFPSFQLTIERRRSTGNKRKDAGQEGGKQTQANRSKLKQNEANRHKYNEYNEDNEDYNKEDDEDNYKEEAGVTRARAREGSTSPTAVADPLITYAVNNLGFMSPRAMEELNSFRDELPDDVIRAGIDAALDANVRTWAYARSILNRYADAGYKTVGEIKAAEAKRKAAKANGVSDGTGGKVQNPALNYAQRDYASPASDADIVYMTFDDDDEGG